jgi:acyl carrier protein
MEDAHPIDEQVKSFVAESRGMKPNEIRGESTLLGDLGLDGDVAYGLLSEFAKCFDVDMESFRFEDHFGHEGMQPWQFPYRHLEIDKRILGQTNSRGYSRS